jgi:tetratricopeptide (TPR) repeat protein
MVQRSSTVWLALLLGVVMALCLPFRASAQARPSKAADLAAQAKATFDRGEFHEAADLLKQAYALEPTSALLYNLGRAYQQAGDKADAIEAYEHYLREAGHPADEGAVSATIAQLRAEIQHDEELQSRAEQERRAAKEATEAEAKRRDAALRLESPQRHGMRAPSALPWAMVGVGAAGLGTGGVLGGLALAQHSSAEGAHDVATAMSKQSEATSLATGTNVAFVAGSVLVLAGVVWGLLDLRASTRQRGTRASRGEGTALLDLHF